MTLVGKRYLFSGRVRTAMPKRDMISGRIPLGAQIHTAAISYGVEGRQHITIAAGGALLTFALHVEGGR